MLNCDPHAHHTRSGSMQHDLLWSMYCDVTIRLPRIVLRMDVNAFGTMPEGDEMDHRTQKALDGELPREQLNAAEAADLAAAEAEIAAVLRSVPMQQAPDLAPSVMRRIAETESRRQAQAGQPAPAQQQAQGQHTGETEGPSPMRALLDWIWKPRPISFGWRPAYGLAAAAILAVTLVVGRETAPAPAASQQVLTQFLLDAPNAEQVMLAGDFTDWQPAHALTRTAAGVWTVVVPLNPGVHSYAFVIDGERWVPDPGAPAVDDGFGGLNSRLAVLAPDEVES